jgi:hypothetical protein
MQIAPRASVRRPPDYTSSRVKWRLFVGLAAVMLVLSAIERGADPEFRRWISGAGAVEPAKRFDSRLAEPSWRTQGDPLGTFVAVEAGRGEIRDDTPVFRPAEQEAWFAAIAQVRAIEQPPATRVVYLQLYNQPGEYRGRFVTVKGTVRLAYRTKALENELGVEEYFVYWIHPAGGPDSPILVYALSAPVGFPIAEGPPQAGERPRKMYEDVEVTGVFFKRAAYAGQGGTFTAPLIVARGPNWLRVEEAPARLPLSPLELAITAVLALIFVVCLTAVLWKRSRRPRAAQEAGGFPDLGPLAIGPTPRERLAELERRAQSEGNG